MPDRLSPGAFLSMVRRHPHTGRPIPVDQPIPDGPTSVDPEDCVVHAPSVDAEMTTLVGYDMHGVVRVKVEIAAKDAAWWERIMLRYMRWRFGQPLRVVR